MGGIKNSTKWNLSRAFKFLIARDYHSVIVKADGTFQTVGENSFGQLGNNTTIDTSTVQYNANLNNPLFVDTAWNVTYIVKSDGTLWFAGWNTKNISQSTNLITDEWYPTFTQVIL